LTTFLINQQQLIEEKFTKKNMELTTTTYIFTFLKNTKQKQKKRYKKTFLKNETDAFFSYLSFSTYFCIPIIK